MKHKAPRYTIGNVLVMRFNHSNNNMSLSENESNVGMSYCHGSNEGRRIIRYMNRNNRVAICLVVELMSGLNVHLIQCVARGPFHYKDCFKFW